MAIKTVHLNNLLNRKKELKEAVLRTHLCYKPYENSSFLYILLMEYKGEFLGCCHIELIYKTLKEWGMSSRGARMIPLKTFKSMLKKKRKNLNSFRKLKIDRLSKKKFDKVFSEFNKLFDYFKITRGKTQLIGFSKMLHFILPNLIMPIDRKYTLQFFYNNKNVNTNRQFEYFLEIHQCLHDISQKINFRKMINNRINKNVPKIFDNAIIGYIKNIGFDK
jgi:hypothetical protein